MTERRVDDGEVVALVEQRDFLMKSLDDLDREFSAGDMDEADYATLKDDYTARAAATIRTIDARTAVVKKNQTSLPRRLAWVAGVAALAILAGVFIGRASGSRRAGEFGSGDIRLNTQTLMLQADAALQAQQYDDAIDLYDAVLDTEPANAKAITYRAWVSYRANPVPAEVLDDFDDAIAFDPDYTDALVFSTIVLFDDGQVDEAAAQLKAFDRSNPPEFMQQLVASRSLRENIMEAYFSTEAGQDNRAIASSPFEFDEVLGIARLLATQAQTVPQAQVLFDAVLSQEPDNVEAITYAGWMLAQVWNDLGEDVAVDEATRAELKDSATTLLDRAVGTDPSYPDARVYRAFFRRAQGDDQGSLEDIEAFRVLPEQPAELVALIEAFGLGAKQEN
ncbi:MAG: tetratricopeptide repeat protein [Acidimicrobiales bacterium]